MLPSPMIQFSPPSTEYSQLAPVCRLPTVTVPLLVMPSLFSAPVSSASARVGAGGGARSMVNVCSTMPELPEALVTEAVSEVSPLPWSARRFWGKVTDHWPWASVVAVNSVSPSVTVTSRPSSGDASALVTVPVTSTPACASPVLTTLSSVRSLTVMDGISCTRVMVSAIPLRSASGASSSPMISRLPSPVTERPSSCAALRVAFAPAASSIAASARVATERSTVTPSAMLTLVSPSTSTRDRPTAASS